MNCLIISKIIYIYIYNIHIIIYLQRDTLTFPFRDHDLISSFSIFLEINFELRVLSIQKYARKSFKYFRTMKKRVKA